MSTSKLSELKTIILITVIFVAACIETDIYLPAFPDMMDFFDTSEEMIQSILSWNFIGICLSCPFYGPISEAYGRKKIIMIALGIFLLGSIGTLFAQDIHQMLFFRVLQGLGSGGCFTLGTAIIFDSFQAKKAVEAINDLNTIVPIIMALAPLAGGYLNTHYGFRSNFLVIVIFVALSFIICAFGLDETLPESSRKPLAIKEIIKDMKKAFLHLPFWGATFIISAIFAAYLSYISNISILFINHMGVDSQIFPYYQVCILLSFVAASLTCTRMINKFGINYVKNLGLIFVAVGGIIFSVGSFFLSSHPIFYNIAMSLFSFGAGWVMGPYFTEGMESLPDIKGITAGLITSFRLLFTAIVVGLTGKYFDGSIMPLTWTMISLLITGFVTVYFYEKRTQK